MMVKPAVVPACSGTVTSRKKETAAVQVDRNSFTLSRRSQPQDSACCVIPRAGQPRKNKTVVMEDTHVVARDEGSGEGVTTDG